MTVIKTTALIVVGLAIAYVVCIVWWMVEGGLV